MLEGNETIKKTMGDSTMPRHVLIVEDDDGLRNLILKALRRAGYEADGVATGADTIDRVKADSDLVLLLDQKLPDMAGSDIIKALKKQGRRVPFIVMTGQGDERFAVEMMKLGAADYLVKTIDLVDLLPGVFNRLFRELDNERRLHAAEVRLQQSEEKYREILESMNEGYFELDLAGNFIFVNDAECKKLGYSRDELIGMNYRQYSDEKTATIMYELFNKLYKTDEPIKAFNGGYVKKDGSRGFNEFSATLIRDTEGKSTGFRGLARDITERKRSEEEKRSLETRLQRAEKMEALGTLAGGVAHDLNNVLGIVVGYAEMLLDDVDQTSPLRSSLGNIMDGGQRAAAIVQDLLTLARRGVSSRQVLNLNKIIVDYLKLPEFEKLYSYHPNVKINIDIEPDLFNISGSSVHLGKTLFNLVSNASEAMPNGGIVTIKTVNQYIDKPISGFDDVREGDYVVLTVSDTGDGISTADMNRIFEPFYTKKVMGRSGTGLGLAVVWGTVKDHNGYINVQSEEWKGSIFSLYFPVTREDVPAEAVVVSFSEYLGKGETILVVDDVKGQRDLAAVMLGKLNYKVISVSSGEDAVEYLREHKADLLVLDMIMDPGMDGLDTYRNALKIHPQQKAIIVSGFSESDRVHDAQALGAGSYVRKPYVIEKLGLAVRKELDRK